MAARTFDPDYRWIQRASCRTAKTDLFFPDPDSPKVKNPYVEAKKICAPCPVRLECLRFAIVKHMDDGCWGGMSPKERLEIRMGRAKFPAAG